MDKMVFLGINSRGGVSILFIFDVPTLTRQQVLLEQAKIIPYLKKEKKVTPWPSWGKG